ncbi:MAG: ABC transporter substrate-binding protein [Nitrospinae bacterium]|nr:ABC transporter substrate-binding protein [Nitrospinota bacterium]
MTRSVRWVTACLIAALAFTASCQRNSGRPENTLVIALESSPTVLDPRLSTDATAAKIEGLIFNGLVKRNDDFTLSPDLAESWENPSPTRYIFHLRRNVKFHDGTTFTSRDVKAEFDFISNPASKSFLRAAFSGVQSVETPDEATVIFDLKEPSAPFLDTMTMAIVPAGAGADFAEKPAGTGPFKFVEFKRDEILTLVRNDNHFDGAPKIGRLEFKIMPDETVRTLSLESGEAQVIMNPITPDLLPRFRENKNLSVVTAPGSNYSYIGFNMEDRLTANPAVRKAIAHAIDRESVIRHILKGLARPASGPFYPAMAFHENDVAKFDYDPDRAMRMLDEAGFADPDGPGPMTRFTLRYSTSQNELRKRIAEVFQWQLAKVGIGLDIRSYEWGAFYADIKKGNFQMFSLTWVGISDPDILHYMFHSSSLPPDGANRGRYVNKTLDGLLENGRVTFGDERRQVYSRAQKMIAEDLPYISLWHPENVAVTGRRIKNFSLGPDEGIKSLKDAWIEGQ